MLARRNAILVLMSVELMLNAVNLNLVAFDVWLRDTLHAGQALTLFTIAIAAAEIGIGLAIVLLVYRNRGSSDIDRLRDLADGRRAPRRATAATPQPARRRREGRGRRVTLTDHSPFSSRSCPSSGAAAGLLLGRRAPGFVRPLAVLPTAGRAPRSTVTVAVGRARGAGRPTPPPGSPRPARSRSTSPCTSTASPC